MPLLSIIAALILIQASRAGIFQLLHVFYEPAAIYSDFIFIIIGILLLILFRPSKQCLGLDFSKTAKAAKVLYLLATVLLILLFVTSLILFTDNNPENIVMTIKGVLLYPIFEELLFRGYIWDKLRKNIIKEYRVYIIITLLFGLWHLGYWDIIYYNASHKFSVVNMNWIMLNKVLVGIGYGVVTGIVRLKTKNTYSSILLHSFLNVFGR